MRIGTAYVHTAQLHMLNAYAYVRVCLCFSFGLPADLFAVNFRFYAPQIISVRAAFFLVVLV